MASTEQRIPTETFLLPGQQFCIGLPWERAAATQGPLASPPALKPAPVVGNALDAHAPVLQADPFEGVEIGKCRVLRRLSPGSARSLLAIREDEDDGVALVVLRRIELPDVLGKDVQTNAVWASRFVHPNLARVFESELSDEGIFWVHELASGATLLEVTQACRKQGKGVPHGLVLASVYEAAKGLAELHGPGFPHGLVSDQALALGFDGSCRLLDTGLFRCVANKSSWAEVAEPMGPYFALEQLTQGRMPDPKCDVFSLAVVLYEGLTGEKRRGDFDTRLAQLENGFAPPSRFSITLDKAIDEVVLRGLSKDRAVRYPNAAEFAKALHAAASAFMWKKDQRSRFVRELFPARAFHEDGLMADCAQRAAARAARPKKLSFPLLRALSLTTLPKLAPPPPPAEAVQATPPTLAPAAAPAATARATAADPALPWRRGSLLMGLLLLVTGLGFAEGQLQLTTRLASPELADALGFRAPPHPEVHLPPPPPPLEAQVDVCDAERCSLAPEPPPEPTFSVQPAAPVEPKPALVAARPRPALRKKLASNEVPLPPWLTAKPSRKSRK